MGPAKLNDPSRHRLIEGGLGEVIPAEMYQQVADFQRSAADHMEADHAIDYRGLPQHRGERWFGATARVEILSVTDIEKPEIRYAYSHGFTEPPRIVGRNRRIHGRDAYAWWVEWRSRFERFMVSIIANGPLGTIPVGKVEEDGSGWSRLAVYDTEIDGENQTFILSEDQQMIRSVSVVAW